MADWVALAGIASTAFVAVAAQVGTAATKRGDRKHASQLDFNKRVWDSKSAALVSVITQCQFLKDAADVDLPDIRSTYRDPRRRRGSVVMACEELGNLYDGIGADLLAFADKSVAKPFAEVSKLVNRERSQHHSLLLRIQRRKTEEAQAVDEMDSEASNRFRNFEAAAQSVLGDASTLDVDALVKLCDQTIDAARKDLRGK